MVKLDEIVELEKENKTNKKERPDYVGDGIAVWVKKDRNGKTYLSITLLGKLHFNVFANRKKQ